MLQQVEQLNRRCTRMRTKEHFGSYFSFQIHVDEWFQLQTKGLKGGELVWTLLTHERKKSQSSSINDGGRMDWRVITVSWVWKSITLLIHMAAPAPVGEYPTTLVTHVLCLIMVETIFGSVTTKWRWCMAAKGRGTVTFYSYMALKLCHQCGCKCSSFSKQNRALLYVYRNIKEFLMHPQ